MTLIKLYSWSIGGNRWCVTFNVRRIGGTRRVYKFTNRMITVASSNWTAILANSAITGQYVTALLPYRSNSNEEHNNCARVWVPCDVVGSLFALALAKARTQIPLRGGLTPTTSRSTIKGTPRLHLLDFQMVLHFDSELGGGRGAFYFSRKYNTTLCVNVAVLHEISFREMGSNCTLKRHRQQMPITNCI